MIHIQTAQSSSSPTVASAAEAEAAQKAVIKTTASENTQQCPSPSPEAETELSDSRSFSFKQTSENGASAAFSVKSSMEQSSMGLSSLSPPTTRNSSAHSSPSTSAANVGTHSTEPQQPKQHRSHGRSRGVKHASTASISGHSRKTSTCDVLSPVSTASSIDAPGDAIKAAAGSEAAECKRSGGAHGQGTSKKNDGSKKSSGSGAKSKNSQGKQKRQTQQHPQPQQQQTLSHAPLNSGQSQMTNKGPSQQHRRHQAQHQNLQQPFSRKSSSHGWPPLTPTHFNGDMTASHNRYGRSRSHSKQGSVRSTDEGGSTEYAGHGDGDESEDEEEYAIGFSQEEWDCEVRGRVVLPIGLEKTLTAQILHTYETRLFPSAESIEVKRAFIEKFATILMLEFPDWEIEIHVFGSSVNGLGTSRSDVDICLTTEHKELENVFVLNKVLRKYDMRTYCVPHARVPIVKSWDPELRIASDINVNNTIALHNTRMIQTFVAIDARVRPFIMAIKNWTKCREINDAAFGGTLSPYAWVNLAINFLQMRNPPILPVIHPQDHSVDLDNNGYGVGPVDLQFNDDIEQLRGFGDSNSESLGFLLYAFFRTYAYEFDYRHQVVSLRRGCYLTKAQKGWDIGRPSRILCIEEPFSTWLNLGHSANTTSVEGIRQECQRAFRILRDGGSYDDVCEVYQRPRRTLDPQLVSASQVTGATLVAIGDNGTASGDMGFSALGNGTMDASAMSTANIDSTNTATFGRTKSGKRPYYPARSSSYSPGYVQTPQGVFYSTPGAIPQSATGMQRRESYDSVVVVKNNSGGRSNSRGRGGPRQSSRMLNNPRYWNSTSGQHQDCKQHQRQQSQGDDGEDGACGFNSSDTNKMQQGTLSKQSNRAPRKSSQMLQLGDYMANLSVK